ncbi:MAG: CoB--CoM heterodisulfide reductase iron-sulfur subunit B family protein [Candidatus Latescibacterota bacterium]
MSALGYYPGCSLAGGGIELDLSVRALCRAAGVPLREIDDWNCCGATAAHALNHELAVALPLRVLALAAQQGLTEVLAPCAACFSRLKGTRARLVRSPELKKRAEEVAGCSFDPAVSVLNVVEFVNRVLEQGLRERLTRPLSGLRVAPYYGCLLSRGEGIIEGEDPENPGGMSSALAAAGCEVVPWNFATECCGGGFSLSLKEAVVELSAAVLADAHECGAETLVTGCPMCHSNLDMRQLAVEAAGKGRGGLPVLYLSQVVGLAAGVAPKDLGLDRHYVDALPVAARAQEVVATAASAAAGPSHG